MTHHIPGTRYDDYTKSHRVVAKNCSSQNGSRAVQPTFEKLRDLALSFGTDAVSLSRNETVVALQSR